MDLSLAKITAEKILALFIMLCTGMLGNKIGVLNKERCRILSNILINLIMPFTFFASFQQEFDKTKLLGLGISFVLGIAAHVIPMGIGKLFFRKDPKFRWRIDRFCIIYGNCAFIGIPLIQSLLGYEGVFYVTSFIASFNIFVFTQGVDLMSDGEAVRDLKHQIVLNPVFIGIELGLLCYLCRFILPELVLEPVKAIGNCNTPLAMIIAGSEMTGANFKKILSSARTYAVAATRLFLIPVIMTVIVVVFKVPEDVALSNIICAAAPVGTMATVLAVQYNKDSAYSSGIFAFTTLLCVVTMPIIVAFYTLIR